MKQNRRDGEALQMTIREGQMSQLARTTWIVWIIFFLTIATMVAATSQQRTVTAAYRSASSHWFEGQDIYGEGIHGYLYLPHACILFTPFALLPYEVGEILWRGFGLGILATAVWRLSRLESQRNAGKLFLVMSLFTIPMAMSSARNGQMNLALAALMAHAAIDLVKRNWSTAAFWLTLGVALKPLMISMFLLSAVLYRPLHWRLFLASVLLLLIPFLTQEPAYVSRQYLLFVQKMHIAGNPGEVEPYSDIYGIIRSLGVRVPFTLQTVMRASAALLTLAVSWLGLRRWGHEWGTLLLLSFSACYILLFNPRTENNTYVLLAIPMALFATRAFLVERWFLVGSILTALTICMSASYEITRGHNFWLSPASCLVFLAYVISLLIINRKPATICAN